MNRKRRLPEGGVLLRASQRVLEYWKRGRRRQPKSGKALTLVELEVKRIEAQREVAKRFDEPGLGERKVQFSFVSYIVYPLIVILIVGVPIVAVLVRATEAKKIREPDRNSAAVLPIDEIQVTSDSAREVAELFLDAASIDERLAVVRHPEETRARQSEFPEEVRTHPISFANLRAMGVASASGEARFHRFGVRMNDGGMRFLCVVETNRGPLVDYEAFARYGTATWDELLAGAAADEVRVFAKKSTYYQNRFTDEKAWAAFEITNPDWPGSLIGYAARNSPTHRVLAKIVVNTKQRVTLRLRPEGDGYLQRQLVIEKVLGSGWVLTGGDLEGTWLRRYGGQVSEEEDSSQN